jgi:hypothetical protein
LIELTELSELNESTELTELTDLTDLTELIFMIVSIDWIEVHLSPLDLGSDSIEEINIKYALKDLTIGLRSSLFQK